MANDLAALEKAPLVQVRRMVRQWLSAGASVEFIQHALDEAAKDGLTIMDARFVMRTGAVTAREMHGAEWRITSEGPTARGERTRVVYRVRRVDHFMVVTVMSLDKGWRGGRR